MSRFDLSFEFLLDLDLDPQALAVEAVLVAQLVAGHGVVALKGVLVGAAPGVMDAHRVVGGDRAVEEGPARPALVLLAQLLEGVDLVPELQDRAFLGREIDLRLDFLERHDAPSRFCGIVSILSERLSFSREPRERGSHPRSRGSRLNQRALCGVSRR